MEDLKQRIHTLTNIMQAILGFIELKRYPEALEQTKRAATELKIIAKRLSDTAIILPRDAKVTLAVKPEKYNAVEEEINKLSEEVIVAIVPKKAITVKKRVKKPNGK